MKRLIATVLALGLASPPGLLRADTADATTDTGEKKDYSQITLEELLNRDISTVATKTRVEVAKAPVSVVALTPEDVRRSGATTLGDLLRTIPGLDVLESFPGYITVSSRGTDGAFPNNMLVLIDGRRLETQLAGVAFLEEAPVRLEDIKRIEVVKGPVGALYGTNALAGVISITTYSPDEVQGTMVSATGGNRDTYMGTIRHAAKLGDGTWAYKFTGGYSYSSTWDSMNAGSTLPSNALRKADAVALLEGKMSGDAKLALEAGVSTGDLASLTVVTNQTQMYTYPHLRAAYTQPNFHAQLTWNPQSLELRERVPPVQPLYDQWSQALNLSVDRSLTPFRGSMMTIGGNARYQRSDFTNIGTPHGQMVGSVFVQDEQTVVKDRLVLFGAVGLSHHPEIDPQVDGNAAIVMTPVKDQNIRVSFGRGHRDPTFIENYTTFKRKIGTADAYQSGSTDIAPQSIQSWEGGYHGRFKLSSTARLSLFADVFSEKLLDLINVRVTTVPVGSIPQFPTATILQQFVNLDARDGKGFETGAELDASPIRLVGQYSHQRFTTAATGALVLADIPQDKLSFGLRTQHGPFELDVWVHSVSNTLSPTVTKDDQAYVLLNPRVGVKTGPWMFSLASFNALNDKHLETANARGVKGETIGRSVTFNLQYMR
jgi:iron complex outermembrane receptor protein